MRTIPTILILFFTSYTFACTCFGPTNFCESVDTAWAEPDVIVLATKLTDIHYGMTVKVVDVFGGDVDPGDTLTVWGDNGALCRWYTGAWSIGDTNVYAFHNTDFSGNWIVNPSYPPNLEQPGDYHISICGTYWLNYANGAVTGPIDVNINSLTLNDFASYVDNCFTPIAQNIGGVETIDVDVFSNAGGLVLDFANLPLNGAIIALYDLHGRLILQQAPKNNRILIDSDQIPTGILVVDVIHGSARLTERVFIQ